MLFLIGSAIVAFRGWPQISTGSVTSNLAAAPLAAHPRTAARAEANGVVTHRPAVRAGSAGRGTPIAMPDRRMAVKAIRVSTVKTPGSGTTAGGGAGTAAGLPPAGGTAPAGLPRPHNILTSVARTVSSVGNDVGQQITGLSAAAAGGSASPQAGDLGQAGTTLADTVTSAGNSVANTITTVGNTAGGGN